MFKLLIVFTLVTLNGVIQLINAQSSCINPNRKSGSCSSIYDCPTLLTLLRNTPLSDVDRRFLQESQCNGGYGRPPFVCCTNDIGYTLTNQSTGRAGTGSSSPSNGRGNVLPGPPSCGTEPTGNKIYNGSDTALDQFAWMVLLEYQSRNGQKVQECGGALINQRYVVTAAHCAGGAITRDIGRLVSVRLGEYDTTKDTDCTPDECADPIVTVGVEQVIVHENFNDNSPNRHNDIALIRLDRDVAYTDFIKPVCLPSSLNIQRSPAGTPLTVAGWGRTLQSRKSAIKQKLQIPVADQQECIQKFAARQVNLAESQLCAGGQYAQDSCDGDSGGPLMRLVQNNWALEGIVSFGNKCGLEGWPAVYTRVSSFENWIRSNLRP